MGMRSSSLSCCTNKTLVQDQVCADWSITGAGTQIVYTNNLTQEIYGSGYVKYDTGEFNYSGFFSRCYSSRYDYCTTAK